jgi:hypothetical protein
MTETTLPTEDLQTVFDTAVGSLDFSSGFLDNDEVLALRRVAVVLGVDPMKATPHNFNFVHATCDHDWEVNDKRWKVNPGVTIRFNGHGYVGGDEIKPSGGGDSAILAQMARNGNVTGPEHTWNRRCRKCGCHE